MIPPYLSTDCKSPGEKILFGRFCDDPGTREWVVLHSLGIAKHSKRLEGEVDFVVLVPKGGILCIEVKGGNIAREGGLWKYGSEPHREVSVVGPFRQASDSMHSLRTFVTDADPTLKNLLFFSGVFFTYITFSEHSPEWHPWQFADKTTLTRFPVSTCCLNILERAHEHVRGSPSAKWYDLIRSRPSIEQIGGIAEILRRDFEFFIPPREDIEDKEKRVIQFTTEQFQALDVLEENDRVIFKGPAGTGKTFLAIEAARRAASRKQNTLFLCFNSALGHWFKQQTKGFLSISPGSFFVGTLHQFLLRMSGLGPPETNNHLFWSQQLPENFIDRGLQGIIKVPFCETLIIDEAQDLMTEEYLDVMDLALEGGLAGGRWAMFGDFEHQAIYARLQAGTATDLVQLLKRRSPYHFTFPLRVNCRNAEEIAIGLELMCQIHPGYSRILNTGMHADIEAHFYESQERQLSLLKGTLKALLQNFLPSEIIILSTKENNLSCAQALTADKSIHLQALQDETPEHESIAYASVHAFKGLESPAVIFTDIESFGTELAKSILYTGMSRARLKLIMLLDEKCRVAYLSTIKNGFLARALKGKRNGEPGEKSQ